MISKVLLLAQLDFIREKHDSGVQHGLTDAEAWANAVDKAEEIAKEDNPLMNMIIDCDERYHD